MKKFFLKILVFFRLIDRPALEIYQFAKFVRSKVKKKEGLKANEIWQELRPAVLACKDVTGEPGDRKIDEFVRAMDEVFS